jgi:hypothetical protein
MVEQRPFKALVASSSLAQSTSKISWEWLEYMEFFLENHF